MVVGFLELGWYGGGYFVGGVDVIVGLGIVGVLCLVCLLWDDYEWEYEVEWLELWDEGGVCV